MTRLVPDVPADRGDDAAQHAELHAPFNGFELIGRKRMSNHWMMNTSFWYNSIIQNYGARGSFQNPNNIDKRNGFQYDYATAGSGIGNVFVNAKWLYKLSGMYQLP